MKRQLTWKTIFLTILGVTLLLVVLGLSALLPVGHDKISISNTPAKSIQLAPFDLPTHCGINELMADGRYFQRVGGVLDDGSGNPPADWVQTSAGHLGQRGTLTITGDVAVFRDKEGHVETFKVRPGATRFLNICA